MSVYLFVRPSVRRLSIGFFLPIYLYYLSVCISVYLYLDDLFLRTVTCSLHLDIDHFLGAVGHVPRMTAQNRRYVITSFQDGVNITSVIFIRYIPDTFIVVQVDIRLISSYVQIVSIERRNYLDPILFIKGHRCISTSVVQVHQPTALWGCTDNIVNNKI